VTNAGPRRLLLVVNELQWLWTHRLPVAKAARAAGWDVQVISPPSSFTPRVEAAGFPVHDFLRPRGEDGLGSVMTNARRLRRAYAELAPSVVHHITLRPVLAGSLAVRSGIRCGVVNAIAGLGSAFLGNGTGASTRRRAIIVALRVALRVPRSRTVFQNAEDRNECLRLGLVDAARSVIIPGAGVDLEEFPVQPLPPVQRILFVGRLLRDKGVVEFADAARLIRRQHPGVIFQLCGEPDPANPSSLPESAVRGWVEEGILEWLGQRWDMPRVYADASIVVLPSHREGLPKVLLEAGASGRPSVSTDAPGCREVVRDGVNGLLVPVGDAPALASAILRLLDEPARAHAMGVAARRIVEQEYGVDRVVAATLQLYDTLAAT
jgi:glycosyltransferase involved in cell wall biosynthesis